MSYEFTVEEIKDVARAARIYCPGFTEEKFESLMELERRIGDSAYLGVVLALIRLEEEKGVSFVDALDACKDLLRQKAKLEKEANDLESRVKSLQIETREASEELKGTRDQLKQARKALSETLTKQAWEERNLGARKEKARSEKDLIDKEIEEWRRQANVTREEVDTAGKIKAEVEGHGFTLDLILGLSGEFAGHQNAREDLAKALENHDSLSNHLKDLADRANKERARIDLEVANLQSQKKGLERDRQQLEIILTRLRGDISGEDEIRLFYDRYRRVSVLIDRLMTWDRIFFMRCDNPLFAFTGAIDRHSGNARFWTDKKPMLCPHCGQSRLFYDEGVYQALNWPVGAPYALGEGK